MYYLMHRKKSAHTKSIKDELILCFLISLTALISACSSAPKAYSIKGEADSILNRDINGKSLSVVVRIYQLKDSREFSKLTFDTLADGRPESDFLGSALLDKIDAVVVPGGNYVSTEKLLEETKFVGVVAFFRHPDQYYWRQLVDAEAIRSQGLTFKVQDCYVTLIGVKPVPLPGQPLNARPECATATNVSAPRQSIRPANTGNQQTAQPASGTTERGQKRSWLPQAMPNVNVNAKTPIAPVNVQTGNGGVNAINVGEPAPAPAPAYYGSPRY